MKGFMGLLKNPMFWGCSKMFRCKARKKSNREAYIEIRRAVRFAAQHSSWAFFNSPTSSA